MKIFLSLIFILNVLVMIFLQYTINIQKDTINILNDTVKMQKEVIQIQKETILRLKNSCVAPK